MMFDYQILIKADKAKEMYYLDVIINNLNKVAQNIEFKSYPAASKAAEEIIQNEYKKRGTVW